MAHSEGFSRESYRKSDVMRNVARSGTYPDRFPLHLFSSITKNKGNLIISPLFSFSAFGGMILASKDNTKQEILEAFFDAKNLAEEQESLILLQNRLLVLSAMEGEHTCMKTASFLFLDEELQMSEAFKHKIEDMLDYNVVPLEFSALDPQRLVEKAIESVAQTVLNSKVSEMEINSSDRMMAVECNFFCGQWKYPFSKSLDVENFHNHDSSSSKVSFLSTKGTFKTGLNATFMCNVIEIPHQWSELSMIVILPANGVQLGNIVDGCGGICANVPHLLDTKQFEAKECEVVLPQMQLESLNSFKKYMQSFRVSSIFEKERANIAILEDDCEETDLALTDFLEMSTFRLVNANDIVVAAEGSRSIESFVCNRPFAFMVLYKVGTRRFVLYEGVVQNFN